MTMRGKVYLVGAGPGDPELLTVKAQRILRSADVVLHDALVSPEVLALIPASARVYNVGKRCGRARISQQEIHALLLMCASQGCRVVRLKGGDPLVFGRAGEEMDALRASGVDFEIIPGVSAATAAAAAAGITLTDRRLASRILLLSNHASASHGDAGDRARGEGGATVIAYMLGEDYAGLAEQLRAAGLDGDTPCALISQATCPDQQILTTTVGALPAAPRLPAPVLLIAGEVAACATRTVAPMGLEKFQTREISFEEAAETM
jgi:uroporphyrin-III C-methyltransferase